MMKWAVHVEQMGEERNAYRLLAGKPEGKRPLGKPRRRWVDIIRMELGLMGFLYIEEFYKDVKSALHGNTSQTMQLKSTSTSMISIFRKLHISSSKDRLQFNSDVTVLRMECTMKRKFSFPASTEKPSYKIILFAPANAED
jgi:hypothetical protein